ncbi:MAG: hypothetical protein WBQ34_11585 [Candidatus Acidiferrales bacterium]
MGKEDDHHRRSGGKVGIPWVGRDSQAQWETCLWFSTQRLFHGWQLGV